MKAFIHHYDDRGRRTKKATKVSAAIRWNGDPPILEIILPDKTATRFRAVYITVAEIKKALRRHR